MPLELEVGSLLPAGVHNPEYRQKGKVIALCDFSVGEILTPSHFYATWWMV